MSITPQQKADDIAAIEKFVPNFGKDLQAYEDSIKATGDSLTALNQNIKNYGAKAAAAMRSHSEDDLGALLGPMLINLGISDSPDGGSLSAYYGSQLAAVARGSNLVSDLRNVYSALTNAVNTSTPQGVTQAQDAVNAIGDIIQLAGAEGKDSFLGADTASQLQDVVNKFNTEIFTQVGAGKTYATFGDLRDQATKPGGGVASAELTTLNQEIQDGGSDVATRSQALGIQMSAKEQTLNQFQTLWASLMKQMLSLTQGIIGNKS